MGIGLRGDRAEVRVRHVVSFRQRRAGSGFGYKTTHSGPVAVFKLERPQGKDAERVVTCPHCEAEVTVEVRSGWSSRSGTSSTSRSETSGGPPVSAGGLCGRIG
jgi:hypothetical protein